MYILVRYEPEKIIFSFAKITPRSQIFWALKKVHDFWQNWEIWVFFSSFITNWCLHMVIFLLFKKTAHRVIYILVNKQTWTCFTRYVLTLPFYSNFLYYLLKVFDHKLENMDLRVKNSIRFDIILFAFLIINRFFIIMYMRHKRRGHIYMKSLLINYYELSNTLSILLVLSISLMYKLHNLIAFFIIRLIPNLWINIYYTMYYVPFIINCFQCAFCTKTNLFKMCIYTDIH